MSEFGFGLRILKSKIRIPKSELLCSLYFFNPGSLTTQFADVIQLRPADSSGADDFDLVDDLGVQGENALHTMPKGNLADGEGGSDAAVFEANTNALEHLDAFLIAFLDFDVNFDGVTRIELRDVRSQLLLFNCIDDVHNFSNKSGLFFSVFFRAAS